MKSSYKTALAVAGMSVIFAGCVQRTVYVRQPAPPPAGEPAPETAEVVTDEPPAPKVEVQVVAPGPEFVWTPGYWGWHGRWVWVGGRWVVPPRRHAVWVAGHWGHRGRGYVWVGGHWR
jgi:WXXGXW repeat (2 copies)